MKIGIVVINWNGLNLLKKYLKSIIAIFRVNYFRVKDFISYSVTFSSMDINVITFYILNCACTCQYYHNKNLGYPSIRYTLIVYHHS